MKPEPRHVLVGDYGKYYESANSAHSFMRLMPQVQFSHLEWESHAWPGGYQITYIVKDGGVLWEGPPIYCDHCDHEITFEYGDPDAEDQDT